MAKCTDEDDNSIDNTLLFSNLQPSDFPPCRFRSFSSLVNLLTTISSPIPNTILDSLDSNIELTDIILENQAQRLLSEIKITIENVKGTEFYRKMTEELRNNLDIRTNIKRVLGTEEQMQLVIYALGSIGHSFNSQFQLALSILLRNEFDWIGEIEVFDPMMSPTDCEVCRKLGCQVLSVNEHCRRCVEKPTIFFTPYAFRWIIGNLLDANWCPSSMNRMVLLANSVYNLSEMFAMEGEAGDLHYEVYKTAAKDYASSFDIDTLDDEYIYVFYRFAWIFFNVDPYLEMDTLLPNDFTEKIRSDLRKEYDRQSKRMRDYNHIRNCEERCFKRSLIINEDDDDEDGPEKWRFIEYIAPMRIRYSWHPPSPGWIKLNFNGNVGGYGGVFRNEHKERLVIYSGNLGGADSTVANMEALRQGLRCLTYMSSPVKRLIVEGNDISVIRWINYVPEPPEKVWEPLLEILEVLKNIETVVYHVYEEANSMAIELAKRGANLLNLRVWVSP